ncbi:MAG: hypothetical protein NC313_16675 [Butyrivibrio sp.]|nr:hypothetical protein [Butyrivibrio sp.]
MGSKKGKKRKKGKNAEYLNNKKNIEERGYHEAKKDIKDNGYPGATEDIADGGYLDEEDAEDIGYFDEEDVEDGDSGYLDEEDVEGGDSGYLDEEDAEDGDGGYLDEEDAEDGDGGYLDEEDAEDGDSGYLDEEDAEDGDGGYLDEEDVEDAGYLDEEDVEDNGYLDDDYDEFEDSADGGYDEMKGKITEDYGKAEDKTDETGDEMEAVTKNTDDDVIEQETDEEAGRRKRRRHKRIVMTLLSFLTLAVAFIAGSIYYISSLAYGVCRVEAGVGVSASDFMKNSDENAFFTVNSQPFDIAEPGEYKVKVKSGLFIHWCKLIIEDTIAPQATPVNVVLELGENCDADMFVTDVSDATQTKASYVEIPDFSKAGSQIVRVTLTDKGNNQSIYDVELFISPVFTDVMVEAGSEAPAIESFVIAADDVSFVTPIDNLDYTKVGDYEVSINADGQDYKSMLHVIDTTAPEVEVQNLERYALAPVSADDFTVSINDITQVSAAFAVEPDLSRIGTQDLEIVYTDEGNNDIVKQVELTLIEDTEPPVIEGAVDLEISIGDSVSYRKDVTVTDNCPDGLLMTVDTSQVDLNREGIYPVTYTATDLAGNICEVTVNLIVAPKVYDINEVYAAADAVLAKIITPEMTQLEQARAIFDYVTKHVGYINDSAKEDWVRGAYEGLIYGKGDCYVYACTSKVLLTRAGIVNMDIEKIPAKTLHYWNLVDIGGGWYHFDTTPRKDHPVIFMWSDAQLMDYSEKHNKSHNYDHSLYPVVN